MSQDIWCLKTQCGECRNIIKWQHCILSTNVNVYVSSHHRHYHRHHHHHHQPPPTHAPTHPPTHTDTHTHTHTHTHTPYLKFAKAELTSHVYTCITCQHWHSQHLLILLIKKAYSVNCYSNSSSFLSAVCVIWILSAELLKTCNAVSVMLIDVDTVVVTTTLYTNMLIKKVKEKRTKTLCVLLFLADCASQGSAIPSGEGSGCYSDHQHPEGFLPPSVFTGSLHRYRSPWRC